MDKYFRDLIAFGPTYAFRQLSVDLQLNHRGLSVSGRAKAIAALIGFASRPE